jgi:hypothetical protein
MTKPKNRRAYFTRQGGVPEEPKPAPEGSHEIPRASKQEIRWLIEEAGAASTTEIANKLNDGGFPCASAEKWTANLVDSALRRQDMDGLRDRLRENRGGDEPESGASILEIKQAMDDTVRAALKEYGGSVSVDTFAIKGAVADAVGLVLGDVSKTLAESNEEANEEVRVLVETSVKKVMDGLDLNYIRRVTECTGNNVGEVAKKIDDTCAELHDTVVETLQEHGKKVHDTVEPLVHEVYARIEQRFDALEDKLVEKLTAGVDIDLNKVITDVVDNRLKHHLDAVVNQFAAMVENLRRDLTSNKKGRR